jgi:hypothetical protein
LVLLGSAMVVIGRWQRGAATTAGSIGVAQSPRWRRNHASDALEFPRDLKGPGSPAGSTTPHGRRRARDR